MLGNSRRAVTTNLRYLLEVTGSGRGLSRRARSPHYGTTREFRDYFASDSSKICRHWSRSGLNKMTAHWTAGWRVAAYDMPPESRCVVTVAIGSAADLHPVSIEDPSGPRDAVNTATSVPGERGTRRMSFPESPDRNSAHGCRERPAAFRLTSDREDQSPLAERLRNGWPGRYRSLARSKADISGR